MHDLGGRRGGARNPHVTREQIDLPALRLRGADRNTTSLLAFLDAFKDDSFDRTIPGRVPSRLSPGGRIDSGDDVP